MDERRRTSRPRGIGAESRRTAWPSGCAAVAVFAVVSLGAVNAAADDVPVRSQVEGQPLGANVLRVERAMEFLGQPFDETLRDDLAAARERRDGVAMQKRLDPRVSFVVSINPEQRVKVARGPAAAELRQWGWTPVLVKVLNDAAVAEPLRIASPQAGAVYAGAARNSLERQQQTELAADENTAGSRERFLAVETFADPPMTRTLSGLEVEYAIVLVSSTEAGEREATIAFDVGQGTQDLGFRAEVPVLFDVRPAVPVRLRIRDETGSPSVARLLVIDAQGRVHPPQPKRLAPDFFFQPHVYRADGERLDLPPGEYTITACRGPEYREVVRTLVVPAEADAEAAIEFDVPLERWIDARAHGFISGDHHIHGAGCAHYQSPTEGVGPEDMFRQVKGEGLNVGCVLTWGPCFEFQRRYFGPQADEASEPLTVLKYDLEISGFGSAPLGHVCLLNLRDQTYPGSAGTKDRGWPTWTVPVMRWAKAQGGVTGYPHSDMRVDPEGAAGWLIERHDGDGDGFLAADEATSALVPEAFARIDVDEDGRLSRDELSVSADRAGNELPNLVPPAMTGAGAMEIVVAVPEGVCDFISAMDTGRVGEWNTWYHLLNCGFPLSVSGETDFPCMSSRRVGQGRVYVQLGDVERVDFEAWCRGLAAGRSYVSDGYAHAVRFEVAGKAPGFEDVELASPGEVTVQAAVAFAESMPKAVAHGTLDPPLRRDVGDTRVLHAPRNDERAAPATRVVELVVNGRAVARREVPADGAVHELAFDVPIERSSWVALRQFPQLHTNPVRVLVAGQPIRASRDSARWCAEAVELLWRNRSRHIAEDERPAAREAYDRAVATYARIAAEAP